MMMMNFIPPGAKHLKGNALFMSQKFTSYLGAVETNKAPKLIVLHHRSQAIDMYFSHFRRLVVAGQRVFLKMCFQVFIVLSSADEAGACRVHEGAWGGVVFVVSRVRVSQSSSPFSIYLFVRLRVLVSCSNRLVARVK